MTRVVVCLGVVWMMMTATAVAGTSKPELKTSRTREGATLTLQAGPLTVTQTLSRSAVDIRLEASGDSVQFSGDLSGRVAVARAGARREFSVKTATHDDQSALNQMLADSPALEAFDALLQSPWAQAAEAAAIFRSTREVLRVLQGNYQSIEAMAAVRPIQNASIVPARQRLSPSQCWDTYSRDVIYFTYELQWCLSGVSGQWWNPLATAWCAYEYNLKSSLSAVWLLDCYGVGA